VLLDKDRDGHPILCQLRLRKLQLFENVARLRKNKTVGKERTLEPTTCAKGVRIDSQRGAFRRELRASNW